MIDPVDELAEIVMVRFAMANRGRRAALPDRLRLDAAEDRGGFDNHRCHLVSAIPTATRQLHLLA
jgi:hypothetical protein